MGGQETLTRESPSGLASSLPTVGTAKVGENSLVQVPQVTPPQGPSQAPPEARQGAPVPSKAASKVVPIFEPLEIPRKHVGIKIRYPKKEEDLEDCEFDIVAVHGIGADPEATWTHRHRDPKDKSKVIKEVNWISDNNMLPKVFPKARIMTFGYDSVWYGKAPPKLSLKGVATKVLIDLKKHRKSCPDRPIIFVGHCFGGLVIEQVYLSAKTHSIDYPGIYNAITGMLFLGTPHRGSDMAKSPTLGEFYKLIACQRLATQMDLLSTVAQDNSVLIDTVHDFTRDVGTRKPGPKLFCFFEERETPVGRIAGLDNSPREFMVNEASGSLHGHEKCGMSLDHFQMNKFEDEEDPYFGYVVEQIQNMVDLSGDIIKERGESTHHILQENSQLDDGKKRKTVPMLPYPVAKGFASRDGILTKIQVRFEHSSRVCLVGPCGAGKTHVAVEYADGFFKENPDAKIYWVNASNIAEFELSYQVINRDLKLKIDKRAVLMAEVRDFLKHDDSGNWLMIFDGLEQDDPAQPGAHESPLKSLFEYIPTGHPYGGRVLITTRTKSVATSVVNHKYVVEVPAQLSKHDAAQLIFGGKPSKNPSSTTTKYASKVAEILGNSAGALALVFAYMSTSGSKTTWKSLFECVQAAASKVDSSEPQQKLSQVKGMAGIWEPLFHKLKESHADAARLLQMLCLLDVQSMPFLLLDQHFQTHLSKKDDQVKVLTTFDTLELSVNRRDVRVTPMVRHCVLENLDKNKDEALFLAEAVVELVTEAYPAATVEDNIKCKALKPCAMAALRLSVTSPQTHRNRAFLLFKVAAYDYREKRYERTRKALEECVSLCKAHKGEPKRLEDEAEKLLEETRKAQRKAGKRNAQTQEEAGGSTLKASEKLVPIKQTSEADAVRSTSKAVVASHRRDEGSIRNNIKHSKQILEWCQAKYGANHLDTGRQQYNLALSYDAHGQHAKAEKLYEEAIATMKRIYGSGQANPECLRIQGGLARMYCEQGRFGEAEKTLKEVLKGQEELLGLDHPETLVTRLNAAAVTQELRPDNLDSPAMEMQKVLTAQARLLGSEHPATLRTTCSLALNRRLSGRIDEAGLLYKWALEVQKRTLGEQHPDTIKTMLMLAELEGDVGQ